MNKITICVCSSRSFIDRKEVVRLATSAQKAGWQVDLVPDLCELCEDHDPRVHQLAESCIVGCHERALKSLLAFNDEDECQVFSLRESSAQKVLAQLALEPVEDAEQDRIFEEQLAKFPVKPGEDAWYPTLDKDVCGECGKCFDFCPFGVYEMIDDRVRVMHPHNCKNNCPACARTCPHSAIIFPKYDRSPINGGAEMQEKAVQLDSRTAYTEAFRAKLAQRRAGVSLLKKNEE